MCYVSNLDTWRELEGARVADRHECVFQPVVGQERETLKPGHPTEPSDPRRGVRMPALSERDVRLLSFERGTWRTSGAKEQAISEVLGMTATRYYQLLNELIDRAEALKYDPVLVKRLRAQRARRQRIRSPHPGTK